MKALCHSLMIVGIMLVIGGVVAVFNFDQPSEAFSLAWWMIVGGWSLALIGIGVDILHVFTVVTRESGHTLQPKVESGNGVEHEITRV
jgi:protein-S-isoprenylcysteine O-methyltransferase Ste14